MTAKNQDTPAMLQAVTVYDGVVTTEFFCSAAHMVAEYAKVNQLQLLADMVVTNATVWPKAFMVEPKCLYCGVVIE